MCGYRNHCVACAASFLLGLLLNDASRTIGESEMTQDAAVKASIYFRYRQALCKVIKHVMGGVVASP